IFFAILTTAMTPIQNEIYKALEAMGDKSKFTDAVLAKKLRELTKIDGKKKAVIALADLLPALDQCAANGKIFAVTVTSANDLLIERAESPKEIPLENKQRRQRHEKSQALFTNGDLNEKGGKGGGKPGKGAGKKRTERKSMDVLRIYGEE
ncbi:MAG: hypothetical protein MJ053_06530, partial [Elusimicrobiaceae bacterium]|nr:hypothetical protein [Elusimicrobiaceae bacterium]